MPPSYRVLKGKKFGMVISKLFGIITFPFSPNILDFLVLPDCAAKSMLKYFPSHTKLLFI
jgi:hypothetical protein